MKPVRTEQCSIGYGTLNDIISCRSIVLVSARIVERPVEQYAGGIGECSRCKAVVARVYLSFVKHYPPPARATRTSTFVPPQASRTEQAEVEDLLSLIAAAQGTGSGGRVAGEEVRPGVSSKRVFC